MGKFYRKWDNKSSEVVTQILLKIIISYRQKDEEKPADLQGFCTLVSNIEDCLMKLLPTIDLKESNQISDQIKEDIKRLCGSEQVVTFIEDKKWN